MEESKCAFDDVVQISRTKTVLVEESFAREEISTSTLMMDGTVHILCISSSEKIGDDDRFAILRGRFPVYASPKLFAEIRKVPRQIVDAFEIKNVPMLVRMITDGEQASALEFCTRTGGGMKYPLVRHSCGVDVIKVVVDLTIGIKPVIEVRTLENKYIVNDFIYYRLGVSDRMEGFEEQLKEENIPDFHCLKSRRMRLNGITSSSDHVAGIAVQTNTIKEFNQKHRTFVDSVKVLNADGNDIMRHDSSSELTV